MAKVSTLEGGDKNCQNSVHVVCTRTLTGTYFELFRARSSTKIWVLIAQLCSNYCLMNNVVGNYLEHRSVDILVSQYSIICNDLILDIGIRKSQWYVRYIKGGPQNRRLFVRKFKIVRIGRFWRFQRVWSRKICGIVWVINKKL